MDILPATVTGDDDTPGSAASHGPHHQRQGPLLWAQRPGANAGSAPEPKETLALCQNVISSVRKSKCGLVRKGRWCLPIAKVREKTRRADTTADQPERRLILNSVDSFNAIGLFSESCTAYRRTYPAILTPA